MKLNVMINEFKMEQELRGNSEKTIKNYMQVLEMFIKYIGDIDASELTVNDMNKFQIHLQRKKKYDGHKFKKVRTEEKIGSSTLATYMRRLRVFMNWLYNEEYTEKDFKKYRLPKYTSKVVDYFEAYEVQMILDSFNERSELGLRNKAIVSLMFDCGLRVGEVITLECQNVFFSRGVIKVLGKGDKERIVPMGVITKKLLYKYVNGSRTMPLFETDKLFIMCNGMPITYNAIKMMLQRRSKKLDIHFNAHKFRHTFATSYLQEGGDTFALQDILGHTTQRMSKRYAKVTASYLVNQHKKLSPLDSLHKKRYFH